MSKHFNPRSLTGATCAPTESTMPVVLFQSTLPYGSDLFANFKIKTTPTISIHAPLRERPCLSNRINIHHHFNPRSLTGATGSRQEQSGILWDFNPRSLTGATPRDSVITKVPAHFNPRSLTGATPRNDMVNHSFLISIHAPLRERHAGSIKVSDNMIFQSTLPYGSDRERHFRYQIRRISIHAPLRERHRQAGIAEKLSDISIHAPLRERLPGFKELPTNSDFNPRSLTGATKLDSSYLPLALDFNPRSLTGATGIYKQNKAENAFQSTLPYGSDWL